MSQVALNALAERVWSEVAARPCRVTGRTVQMPPLPSGASEAERPAAAGDFPVLRHFEAALDAAAQGPLSGLAEQLRKSASALLWSQNPGYREDTIGRHFLDNYAYALMTGPEGPLVCPAPYGGFILLGPELTYDDHKHAPREIYLVLTPGASWSLDSGPWFDVTPGDLIFHDSWQPHATQVGDQPFLAFVAWLDESPRDVVEI